MFTNLSRRSQGLIQRQLSLISELESREADPDQLSSLFKLDHLATRMRRNGENLLVLAGEEPGRRWTRPVPLVDVLRAAASEVEQYERIELSSVPTTEVAGRVVNDLVHLLAELLENATSFSSPQTKVKVTGHALPDGRVLIEIHDTGIGLSPEDLAAINERLAAPPTVDVSVSRRMGLFVVGRLSQRHGIRIQLRPSDSGGTTALVMLPVDVAQGGKKPMPGKPGQGAPGLGGPAASQASAGVAAARRNGGQQGAPSLGAGAPAGGGSLGAPPQRGQVGAGQGPRAALPGSNQGGRPGAAGGARGPQGAGAGQQNRQAPSGANAFGQSPQGYQAQNGSPQQGFGDGSGSQNVFGDTSGARQNGNGNGYGNGSGNGARTNGFGDSGPAAAATPPPAPASGKGKGSRRRPQLPGRGGARAELPGGNTGSRAPSWSDDNAQPSVPRSALDTPRGHEDPDATSRMPRIDDRQGPSSTSEFARPDFDAPRPGASAPQNTGQNTGQYNRPANYGPGNPSSVGQNPAGTGQFATQGYGASQDPSSTGQFAQPGYGASQDPASTGQFAAPGYGNGQNMSSTGQYERPANPQPPVRPQGPEALPPASNSGDGRTPLYDTLETNWFHGQADGGAPADGTPQNNVPQNNGSQGSMQVAPQQPQTPPAPQQRPAAAPASTSWRSSPNDDLVKQAERVRQPSAGGVTTSGLPRRVPKANLVAGTAQQQQHQGGPQVSRAPDDVRGRLTNLRRGIQQGRQAAPNGQTGSFPSPTHQQER
jgi:hypothetical protein